MRSARPGDASEQRQNVIGGTIPIRPHLLPSPLVLAIASCPLHASKGRGATGGLAPALR
jgi:hypothetical protein